MNLKWMDMSVARTVFDRSSRKNAPVPGFERITPRPCVRITCRRRAQCICSNADWLLYTTESGVCAFSCRTSVNTSRY